MQTVTLETARKLKEAGYPQDTYLWWQPPKWDHGGTEPLAPSNSPYEIGPYEGWSMGVIFAAPTAGELMKWFLENGHPLIIGSLQAMGPDGWRVECPEFSAVGQYHTNPAEALGLLALQLLKGGDV